MHRIFASLPDYHHHRAEAIRKNYTGKNVFSKNGLCQFEEPDQRLLAIEDPRGFLSKFPDGAILDEIQRTPELPSYIQSIVDAQSRNGVFILTGSQKFEISQSIRQSLAGRTALVNSFRLV